MLPLPAFSTTWQLQDIWWQLPVFHSVLLCLKMCAAISDAMQGFTWLRCLLSLYSAIVAVNHLWSS